MKSSRSKTHRKAHAIPRLQFDENCQLTSFSGLVVFQALFACLDLRTRLRRAFAHLYPTGKIVGYVKVFLLLVVHLLLGNRRLRGLDYYRDDPLVQRVVGLSRLPDVATISRTLADFDERAAQRAHELLKTMVLDRLTYERFPCVTLDFDGSVQSTKGRVEGSAIGFNKIKKGARSYYPLFCTVSQTGQFLAMHHRPGNVHDSNGATQFMRECFDGVRARMRRVHLESRMDAAFFDGRRMVELDKQGVEFTCSVPFARLAALKGLVEAQDQWTRANATVEAAELDYKPDCWPSTPGLRFIAVRTKKKKQIKEALQLDLFEPRDFDYDYQVIMSNKTGPARRVLHFHHGRGYQEKILGEAKQHAGLGLIVTRRLVANKMFTTAAMMAHNLSRELQMRARAPKRRTSPRRPPRFDFIELGTLRQRLLHRAGRLLRPEGRLTLVINSNKKVEKELRRLLKGERMAA